MSHLSTAPAFDLRQVTLRYPESERAILEHLSLTVFDGEFLSIVGPSGCGKSTLLKLLAGLILPSAGEVIRSDSAHASTNRTGFVFQHPTLLPWRTAKANLLLPLELGRSRNHAPLSSTECDELLAQVGLTAADSSKRPQQLSGGMQMRLSLARALATKPDVLLLDEPFAAVDDLLRLKLQEDVRRIHEHRRLTSVLVTHNLHEAVFLSDRVIVLSGTPSHLVASVAVSCTGSRTADFRESAGFYESIRTISAALFRTSDTVTEVSA